MNSSTMERAPTILVMPCEIKLVTCAQNRNGYQAFRLLAERYDEGSQGRQLTKLSHILACDSGLNMDPLLDYYSRLGSTPSTRGTKEVFVSSVKTATLPGRVPPETGL